MWVVSAPTWYKLATEAGALPLASGEHGAHSVMSADGARWLTDCDGTDGYPLTGGAYVDGEETRGSAFADMTDAVSWLLNGPGRDE